MRLKERRRDWLGVREILYLRVPTATRAEATTLARERGVTLNVLVPGSDRSGEQTERHHEVTA